MIDTPWALLREDNDEVKRLKRQRDEARGELNALKSGEHLLFSQRVLGTVMQERDEARQQEQIHYDNFLSMKKERDEAIELHRKSLREREATEREVDAMAMRALKAERQRDEARAALADEIERGKVLRGMLESTRSPETQWVEVGDALPEDGTWVLHMCAGARAPIYGVYRNGIFYCDAGFQSCRATHWLPVPMIGKREEEGGK